MTEPIVPDGNDEGKSEWEKAGFASEAEMIKTATDAKDLRSEIMAKEAELEKERTAKSKTNSEFMRQTTEIGDLRKKLKDLEKPPEEQQTIDDKSIDEILESVSDEEDVAFLGVLNDPKNVETKKLVEKGGDKAKAEFIKNYRLNVPVQSSVLTFKKRKPNTVELSAIAKQVKAMFAEHHNEERNNLAVAPTGGALPDKGEAKKQPRLSGGVPADFFRKKE